MAGGGKSKPSDGADPGNGNTRQAAKGGPGYAAKGVNRQTRLPHHGGKAQEPEGPPAWMAFGGEDGREKNRIGAEASGPAEGPL